MRSLAICGAGVREARPDNQTLRTITMEGVPVHCGILETEPPRFEPEGAHRDSVLCRIRAFSCNYRDKSLILRMAVTDRRTGFYVVGSEFVAEVQAVGRNVTDLSPGDRVIGDNAYPFSGVDGLAPGIPTNHGSREVQILHRAKLMAIPPSMSDDVAAGFSIGGQTAYSMIRRLGLSDGETVLVTAAKSNTSLFALSALSKKNVTVYALSTSDRQTRALYDLGVKEVFVADPRQGPLIAHPELQRVAVACGGFNAVIDPFFDLYLPHMPAIMAMGGRYVTCGLYDQYLGMVGKGGGPETPVASAGIMVLVMMKNLSIIGNCIGQTSDLAAAVADYTAGRLPVQIDSVFEDDPAAFLERTYNAPERFGKVIYRYR